ncbi:uncharacterized protein LOC142167183 [Nicotiana tabacum]|uniref:Uncharacterized protein LOC142167183 n=1 Tax=Nicotiana tabacum TaxID=4097 RepID=A0AC58SES7_TOBAC
MKRKGNNTIQHIAGIDNTATSHEEQPQNPGRISSFHKLSFIADQDFSGNVLDQDEQQMSIELRHAETEEAFHITVIYAKCKPHLRRSLWETLRFKYTMCNFPWCVIGDFNVIVSVEEKIGGVPYQMNKSLDFLTMIEYCGLTDLGNYGPRHTWSNERDHYSIVWKRLDRSLVNEKWLTFFPTTIVTHLASTGSDHSPFLMEMHKLKVVTKALSLWSREQYGDIFQKPKEFEQKVKEAEEKWINTNNLVDRINLHEVQTQYVRYLRTEEAILKKKTQLQLFKEDIGEATYNYFKDLFNETWGVIRQDLLSYIPTMISSEDNTNLTRDPTMQELNKVVFSMSPNSSTGPDGMNGKFFQSCWDIISRDLLNIVLAFFGGSTMPRYITNACLILLPKVEFPNSLTEFRPISLINFINKIISKVISTRLATILPRIISANQSVFVKGRTISENIMLAQEIVQGIKKPNPGANVVIKLDMAKAYDRVS